MRSRRARRAPHGLVSRHLYGFPALNRLADALPHRVHPSERRQRLQLEAGAVGDGDGYGTVFVVENEADWHYYVTCYEKKTVERFDHKFGVGEPYQGSLHPMPTGMWPER